MITKSTRMKIFSDRKMPAKRIKPDREVELNEKGCPMQKSRARPVQIIARNRGQNFISKIQGCASSDSANKREVDAEIVAPSPTSVKYSRKAARQR